MENVLGLIGFAVFIVCVISLAAGVTWTVVKLSPLPQEGKRPKAEAVPDKEAT